MHLARPSDPTDDLGLAVSLAELIALFQTQQAEGEVFLPFDVPSNDFRLTLRFGPIRYSGQQCRLTRQSTPEGAWVRIQATAELQALIALSAPSKASDFTVTFNGLADLVERWETDLSLGRVYIKSATPTAVGRQLSVHLVVQEVCFALGLATVVHVSPGGFGVRLNPESVAQLMPLASLVQRYRARPCSVLVVDDEPVWRQVLTRALTRGGINVRSVGDGYAGLADLTTHLYETDLVISDWRMPHIEGGEFAKRLHRLGRAADLRCILLTGAACEAATSLHASLFDCVLSKTDSIESIAKHVFRILGREVRPTSGTTLDSCRKT